MPIVSEPFSASSVQLGVNLQENTTEPRFGLGVRSQDQHGNMYVYTRAGEDITAMSWIRLDVAGVAYMCDAAGDVISGISANAVSTDAYFWVGVTGTFADGLVADGAANTNFLIYSTNSSGQAQIASATSTNTNTGYRARIMSVPASNRATVRLYGAD